MQKTIKDLIYGWRDQETPNERAMQLLREWTYAKTYSYLATTQNIDLGEPEEVKNDFISMRLFRELLSKP